MNQLPVDIPLGPFVNGAHLTLAGVETVATLDPATGSVLAQVPIADAKIVDQAVMAAKTALQGEWSRTLPAVRSRILFRTAALIREHAENLAIVESMDSGKPLREAKGDIETSARYFEYYAGIADKLQGATIPLGPDYVSMTVLQPIGVTAHIIPWNFPLVTTARGVAPCLAAGATAVVKPAEETPLTALLLGRLLKEAGLPDGVYNVVCGPGALTGASLVAHPEIVHVTFTGSTDTGKIVMKTAAERTAAVTLELGGKSPVVVLGDADLDAALEGVLKAIFTNAGQVCSAGSRLVIERCVADGFLKRLVDATEKLSVGKGLTDPGVGPVISATQLQKIADIVAQATGRGAQVLTGGPSAYQRDWKAEISTLRQSYWPPMRTMPWCRKKSSARCWPCRLQTISSMPYVWPTARGFGLVAGIYTENISKANRFAQQVDAGQVYINQYFAGGVETPFGGTKASGFGREKGLEGLRAYLQVKTVTTRL